MMGEWQNLGGTPPTCWAVHWGCVCLEPSGHDGHHLCPCTGSWEFSDDGNAVRIHSFPGVGPEPLPVPGPWEENTQSESEKEGVREQWKKHKRVFGEWPVQQDRSSGSLVGLLNFMATSTMFGSWDDYDDEDDDVIETTGYETPPKQLGLG